MKDQETEGGQLGIKRLPPAPPLTPPELSSAVFTIEREPHTQDSFIHQPNPDYMASTASSAGTSHEPTSRPRPRSYHQPIPVGTPAPRRASSSEATPSSLTFSPSSHPSTSPLLILPPPGRHEGGFMQGVGVKGEIVSVLDGGGTGWTRHTRVYGSGVCLACAASDGQHGGGFYGATVAPEEMQ